MKNIKYLIFILSVAVMTVSCENYDDFEEDRLPTIGFVKKNQNINSIAPGTTKSESVQVFISDVSSSDRTFEVIQITIPENEEGEYPPTGQENVSFDSTVTIPAGERIGLVTVSGTNVTLTGDRTFYRLAIKGSENAASGGRITVGLRQ